MTARILQVAGVCGMSAAIVFIVFLLTGIWSKVKLREYTTASIVALACAWLFYSLAKGRLDFIPLAYGGFGIALAGNRQERRTFTLFALNLYAGAGACFFLSIYAVFGATLDGVVGSMAERWLVVGMYLWSIVNAAVLLRVGYLDGNLRELTRRMMTRRMAFHIAMGIILALIVIALVILVFAWMWVQVGTR